jgi:hypothetical protein
MFVGDSLSLNQFQSLTCMIQAQVPNSKTTFIRKDGLASVTFEVMFLIFASFYCCYLHFISFHVEFELEAILDGLSGHTACTSSPFLPIF